MDLESCWKDTFCEEVSSSLVSEALKTDIPDSFPRTVQELDRGVFQEDTRRRCSYKNQIPEAHLNYTETEKTPPYAK